MPPRIDFKSQRIFVDHALEAGLQHPLSDDHAHYLLTVLRMETGAKILAFNGKDGEWRAEVTRASKRAGSLTILERTRQQTPLNDLTLYFAPIKKERMDWLVQKAVEMGAGTLVPVITDHTQTTKLRMDKLQANVIEAAEQCGVLAVPTLGEPLALAQMLADLRTTTQATFETTKPTSCLLWCNEHATSANMLDVLSGLRGKPLSVLIGPEGGFSEAERETLSQLPFAHSVSLGPRILRADTAVVASLAAVQLIAGDWKD